MKNNKDYVYIALGSNQGDRKNNLEISIKKLVERDVEFIESSPLYITAALLLDGSPNKWNIPYYNAVIKVNTSIDPFNLLKICKEIEAEIGHDNTKAWHPRAIDLDIIYYKGENINTEELTIPHKQLYNRGFWQDCLSFIFPEISKVKYGNEHQSLIMGILNITPDSFSDGGIYNNFEKFKNTFNLWNKKNVHIIDIGAESTNPKSQAIKNKEELLRLECIFNYVKNYKKEYLSSLFSIDTYHFETAQKAIESGFNIVNDVSGFQDKKMLELAQSNKNVKFVFMHNLGIPSNKNIYIDELKNPISEIQNWLENKLEIFDKNNIKKEQLIFDFGLGFGKTASQNLRLLQNIEKFYNYGIKILVGHSRKSFMNIFCNEENKDIETLAISGKIYNKIDILRVHTPIEHQKMILASEHINNQFVQ